MGGNILRRQIITSSLFRCAFACTAFLLCAAFKVAGQDAVSVRIHRVQRSFPAQQTDCEAYAPHQSHMGPLVFSLEVKYTKTLEQAFNRYSQPEGLQFIARSLERAKPYRDFIAEKIQEFGMPQELIYLPVIESAYRINAVSRAGAVGLWQFMRNSISPYGLQITDWHDERMDFWKSTEASLKKLKYNYDYYGDWLLALGAYNCGLTRMNKAIKSAGKRDFWALAEGGFLPRETALYVPKFLAIAAIASYGGRYGLPVSWEAPRKWDRIALDQAVDLSLLAQESGVPLSVLSEGNAELKYNLTPPVSKTYYLKIPIEYSEQVKKTLENKDIKLIKFYLHTIHSGDTLYALAKHYGISIPMITKYNPGIKPQALKIGQKIVIPALKETGPFVRKTVALSETDFSLSYTVQSGDSLWSIAAKFGTTPEALAEQNGLSLNSIIRNGMSLKVPKL